MTKEGKWSGRNRYEYVNSKSAPPENIQWHATCLYWTGSEAREKHPNINTNFSFLLQDPALFGKNLGRILTLRALGEIIPWFVLSCLFSQNMVTLPVQTLWSSHAETAPLCHRQDQKLQRSFGRTEQHHPALKRTVRFVTSSLLNFHPNWKVYALANCF